MQKCKHFICEENPSAFSQELPPEELVPPDSFQWAQLSRDTEAATAMVQEGLATLNPGSQLWCHPYNAGSLGMCNAIVLG